MTKVKWIAATLAAVLCIVGAYLLCTTYFGSANWVVRFASELDRFFGEDNWELLSSETNESRMFTVRGGSTRDGGPEREWPGSYKNWYIGFTNRSGEEEVWRLTNHTLLINHDRHGIFSSKRYTNRQALVLELMDISCSLVGEEVRREIVEQVLTEPEAACIDVEMSYHGGNPEPGFYDELWKQPWFEANRVTAEDFLSCPLHDFYLNIRLFDYRFKNLTPEQQAHVSGSFETLTELLLRRYGSDASFVLYFGPEQRVEYVGGVRQKD